MSSQTEVELKFLVPQDVRTAIAAEMARGSASLERRSLAAMYLDTEDRRLARASIAWRLRREGRRWIQTLKAGGASALERFEHEVIRPDASHDAAAHAGTLVGERLSRILRDARDDGLEVGVRFQTEVRRTARRIRTRGAVVEVAFDEGRLLAGGARLRIREIEFELVSGSAAAMLALAERWRKRFGLVYDPRSKAERGDRLAEGSAFPPLRKASPPDYPRDANAVEAFGAVLDECLGHISRNAIGLVAGDAALRVEHVHQMRVGIRRLRSALRSYEGWVPAPPPAIIDELRGLFSTLGLARDSDVLDRGVVAELAKVGAPPLAMPAGAAAPDPVALVRASETQRLLLAWIAWRARLAEGLGDAIEAAAGEPATSEPTTGGGAAAAAIDGSIPAQAPADAARADAVPAQAGSAQKDGVEEPAAQPDGQADDGAQRAVHDRAATFHRDAQRRLRRWHRRIVADWKGFDDLDETSLHSLRKRIKRQRYAVEFFTPVLRGRRVERYLKPLGTIQDRMGELNDLFVARTRYQPLIASDPGAWFALGWLAARIAEVRALAKPELKRLANTEPPTY